MQNIKETNITNITNLRPRKQVLLFVIGLVGLVLIEIVLQLLISSIAKIASPSDYAYETFSNSPMSAMLLNGLSYLSLAIIFIILLKDDTSELFKSFKNWKCYVAAGIGFAAIISFNLMYNLILNAANVLVEDNANESALNSIVTSFPMLSLLIFGIVGPICEELTYRVGLYSLVRRVNTIFAFIVTMIVFTLIHFDFTSATMTNELLNIPFYAFAAFVFTFLYEKFGLAASVSAHVTNNLFSIGATILTIIK